jgi:mycothiol system anti-sigma-R factor
VEQQGPNSERVKPAGGPDTELPRPSASGFLDCDETIERLYFYLDGELTDERRVEIQRHLDLCGPCVQAFGFETELRKLIANRCRDHVPDSLMDRVAAAIHDEQRRQAN